MDAPLSLPRMFVAALFAAAVRWRRSRARAACPGGGPGGSASGPSAAASPRSRPAAQCTPTRCKALGDAVGARGALLVSALAAATVVGALWFLSRHERRDRRRVLSVLALYAAPPWASRPSPPPSPAPAGGASTWAATATFLEESGEALAGVGFLIAVLAGVAPRLVLPATWPLRRSADAHTLDVAQLPVRAPLDGPAGTR